MRVDTYIPSLLDGLRPYAAQGPAAAVGQQGGQPIDMLLGPAVLVDISPEGRAAYDASKAEALPGADKTGSAAECQTCKNRTYVDGSNDGTVSFQSPTRIDPKAAASAVSAHEGEHVSHESAKAERDGRKIVSQTVSIKTSICPECGRVYVAGGETRTVTKSREKKPGGPEDMVGQLFKGLEP